MLKKILPKLLPPALLLILVGVLCYSNYVPGTILSGWDTLHPEFNFWLYLKRAFFGAWQEHQGIGAPAAQAFASELTRLPIVYFLTLIFPMTMVRYSYFFLTLAVGTLGIYFLAKNFLEEHIGKFVRPAAFLAGVFYLLNLATLQQYFDPLEMFATHFATLPWLILTAVNYLKKGGKKNLILFSLVTLLSTSIAATATLFYVYFAAFCLFVFTSAILIKKTRLKRAGLLILITLTLNSFWLLPNIYYVVREAGTVENSKISRTFSDEAYLQSRAFGNIDSFMLLQNFPFNWREYDFSTNTFEDLMRTWDSHLAKPGVADIGFAAVFIALSGIIASFWRKSKFAISLLPVLGIGIFFWLSGIPKEFSLLREALRFPFTKFSILIIMSLSVFFAFATQTILTFLGKIKLEFVYVILVTAGLIYFMLPAFQGNFIDPSMKVKIPAEYFQAFDWFKSADPEGRVAKLPMQTFWDWSYYKWGYQGGGFTWFGIPEPTMDREFDRWGLYNEDFYFQASSSLYGNDPAGFILTLKKYQIKYLMLDESVINAGGKPDLLYIPQIKNLLSNSPDIKVAAKFGFITIYETDFVKGNDYITAPNVEINNVPALLTKGKLLVNEDLSVNHGFVQAYNCDIKKLGSVSKENSANGIDFKASDGGVACDYINFENLKYGNAYILRVAGENITGRSLKIYLTNYQTGRADLEELLPGGKFDKEFYIYPTNLKGSGYSLNFETRSYGPIASENIVNKVEIYSASVPEVSTKEVSFENNLKVTDVKKYGSWAYVVTVEGSGLLKLGQGYESGWKAFPTRSYHLSFISFQLPDFLHELPHAKFNGWANSWKVDFGSCAQLVTGNCKLIIVYWPQFLEFGGIVVALVSILILFVRKH